MHFLNCYINTCNVTLTRYVAHSGYVLLPLMTSNLEFYFGSCITSWWHWTSPAQTDSPDHACATQLLWVVQNPFYHLFTIPQSGPARKIGEHVFTQYKGQFQKITSVTDADTTSVIALWLYAVLYTLLHPVFLGTSETSSWDSFWSLASTLLSNKSKF